MKRRTKKILRIFLWSLAGFIILVAVLHTPPFRSLAKGILSRTVSGRVEGQLEIGHISYRLWRGEATLEGITFAMPGIQAQVDRVEVSLFSGEGIAFKIENPAILIGEEYQHKSVKREKPVWMPLKHIGMVVIDNGRLAWENKSIPVEVVGSLSFKRQSLFGLARKTAWLLTGEMRGKVAQSSPFPLKLEAKVELLGENLRIDQSRLDIGSSTLSAQGVFTHSAPVAGDLNGEFQLDDSLARSISPELPVQGNINGNFQLKMHDSVMAGNFEIGSAHISLAGSGPWALKSEARYDGKEVYLDSFVLAGYQGTVDIQGRLDLNRNKGNAAVKIKDLDVDSLVSVWGEPPLSLASRLGADIELSLEGREIEKAEARGFVQLDALPNEGVPLSGKVDIKLGRGELSFDSRSFAIYKSRAEFSGKISPDDLQAEYELRLPVSDVLSFSKDLKIPIPDILAEGSLEMSGEISGSLEDLTLSTQIMSDDLRIGSSDYRINAEFAADPSSVFIKKTEILSGLGKIQMDGRIPVSDSEENWDLSVTVDSFDLSDFTVGFGYKMSLDGSMAVSGEAKKPVWEAALQSALFEPELSSQTGSLSLRMHGQNQDIELEELKADMFSGSLVASGHYSLNTRILKGQMKGSGFRLQEIPQISREFDGLKGTIALGAVIQGPLSVPNARLNLEVSDLFFAESSLPGFSFIMNTEGKRAEIKGLAGEAFLSGSCSLEGTFPLQLEIDIAAFPINKMLPAFPRLSQLEVTSAQGQLHLDLPLCNPSEISYRAQIERIEGAYGPQDWSVSPFSLEGERESLNISGFHLKLGEDFLELNGLVPLQRGGIIDVDFKADLDLSTLNPFLPNGEIEGQAYADLQFSGTREQLRVSAHAMLKECRGNWRDLRWENLELRLTGTEEGFQLETLSLQFPEGGLSAGGHMFWTPSGLDSTFIFELDRLNLKDLLPDRQSAQMPEVRVSGKGEVRAADLSLQGLTGSGVFSRIDTESAGESISLRNPAEWNLEAGRMALLPTRFIGENTDFSVSFTYDSQKTPSDWALDMRGSVNTALANSLIQDNNIRLSGSTEIKLEIKNQSGKLSGQAMVEGGRVHVRDPSVSLTRFQMQILFQDQIIEIAKMQGEVGTGEIQISGRLKPDDSGNWTDIDLQISADNVPLSLSDGITTQLSAETRLLGSGRKYTLSGSVILPRILFRQELQSGSDSLVYIERQLKSLEEEPSLLDLISLDLRAEIQELRVENSMARLSAEGILSIKGNLALPDLNGSIRIREGGTINIGRALVRIEEGRVTLEDFPDSPLDVSLTGVSRIRGTFIELNVKGSSDDLQTQIFSPERPDLTQGDLAMLLMTGRTSAAAVSEARTVVTEELAAGLGGMLQQQVGEKVYIDISSGESDFSYDADPTTRFSLGHLVAPNLYVIYSTALNGTKSRGLLDFRPPQPFRLRYIFEEDGRRIIGAAHTVGFRLRSLQRQKTLRDEDIAHIQGIVFEGEAPLQQNELRKLSGLKPGRRYKYWEAQRGAEKIRNKLVKLGYRSAQVDFEERPASAGVVDVIFFLETGKRVNFIWEGDELRQGVRKKVEALWDGRLSEDAEAEFLAQQAVYFLQAERFYQARVRPSLTKTDTAISVRFGVSKGKKGSRVVLKFQGNEFLPENKLIEALPKATKPDFFALIDKDINMLKRTIHVLYASEGYLQGQVEDIRTAYAEDSQEMFVTILVEEGPQAMIASVNLPPEAVEILGQSEAVLHMKKDFPFRLEDYVSDRSILGDLYKEQGFSHPQVSGALKPSEDKIAVYFTVTKGPKARVGEIRLKRPGRTRQATVEKALTLKKGDQIFPEDLALSRKRLYDMRAFQSVDIQPVPSEQGEAVQDLVVELVDKPELQVNYGVRYVLHNPTLNEDASNRDYSPFEFGGGLQILNPFGFGHRYGTSGYFFGKDQFYRLFFESESFFGFRFPTQVILSQDWLRELQVTGVKSRINRITFQQHYLWGEGAGGNLWRDRLRLQWNYSFRHIRLTPLDEQQPPLETDRASVSLSLIGDTRDSFVNTEKGIFWSLSSEFARTWLGSDVNFLKLYGQIYLFIPIRNKIIWASGLRLGAVPGENPFLIIEDRFTAGGVYSVRGFPQFYLGPKNERGEPLGGQAVVIFNQELRFPLYKSLHGGIFYDTGNVFALVQQMSLSEFRHSAGLGLRYVLPFGPIRFDWAYVLDPKPGESRYRFMFTIGHVF